MASITLSSSLFHFYVRGRAGLEVIGIKIGVDVEGSVTVTGHTLSISVRGSVSTIFGTVYGPWVTFSLGSIDPPPAPQVDALEPVLATRLSDGTLRLNMGSYAWAREVPEYTGIQNEVYEIRHVSGVAGSETVRVYAFGYGQIYRGVKTILVHNAGSGNDSIRIQSGVLASAQINGGDGNDTVFYAGSGTAMIDGGSGNDILTVVGGQGHTLTGGQRSAGRGIGR
jgi:Ca2+-binding RTX toxin-like protein